MIYDGNGNKNEDKTGQSVSELSVIHISEITHLITL
jgi:hypothetical protein